MVAMGYRVKYRWRVVLQTRGRSRARAPGRVGISRRVGTTSSESAASSGPARTGRRAPRSLPRAPRAPAVGPRDRSPGGARPPPDVGTGRWWCQHRDLRPSETGSVRTRESPRREPGAICGGAYRSRTYDLLRVEQGPVRFAVMDTHLIWSRIPSISQLSGIIVVPRPCAGSTSSWLLRTLPGGVWGQFGTGPGPPLGCRG
jgi:hypothetical protein